MTLSRLAVEKSSVGKVTGSVGVEVVDASNELGASDVVGSATGTVEANLEGCELIIVRIAIEAGRCLVLLAVKWWSDRVDGSVALEACYF